MSGFTPIIGVLAFVNVCGFLANGLVLAIICKNRRVRKTLNYFFVISLTVADLLYNISIFPLNLYYRSTGGVGFGETLCKFYFTGGRITHLASVLSLLTLNVEKFLYIAVPFEYIEMVKKSRVFIALITVWVISTIWGGLTVTAEPATKESSSTNTTLNNFTTITATTKSCKFRNNLMLDIIGPIALYLLPMLICIILSFLVLKIVLRHRRALDASLDNTTSGKYGRKLCRSVCFVLATTFLSAALILPYWTVHAVNYFCGYCVDRTFIFTVMINFPAVNAVINPYVTIVTQKFYRSQAYRWLISACAAMNIDCVFRYVAMATRKISRSISGMHGSSSNGLSSTSDKKTLSTSLDDESCDVKINILVRCPEQIMRREMSKKFRKIAIVDNVIFTNPAFNNDGDRSSSAESSI